MAFVEENQNDTPAAQMRDFRKRQQGKEQQQDTHEKRERRSNREERQERSSDRQSRQERQERKGSEMPFSTLSSLTATPFGGGKTKVLEGVKAAYRRLQESKATDVEGLEYQIMPIDGASVQLKFDTTVAFVTKGSVTYAYVLLLQTSSQLGYQQTDDDRRDSLPYTALPEDGYTEGYRTKVAALIKKKNPSTNVIWVGAITIPANYDYKSEVAMDLLLQQAFICLYFQQAGEDISITVDMLVDAQRDDENDDEYNERRNRRSRRKGGLVSEVMYKPQETTNWLGQPVINDLAVRVGFVGSRNSTRNAVETNSDLDVGQVQADVDVVWYDQSATRFRQRDDVRQVYALSLNIHNIGNPDKDLIGLHLLTLANLPLLVDEGVLSKALMPMSGEIRYRDPKAFAYEQGPKFPVDLLEDGVDERTWDDLVDSICKEDKIFLFWHQAETGQQNSLARLMFSACDDRDPASDDSYELLNMEINKLTNNAWDDIAPENLTFGRLEERFSLQGVWKNENGEERPLSEIGYFNLLTRFGKDHPEYLELYSEIISDNLDYDVALAKLEELLTAYCGKGGFTIQNRCKVLRLNPEAIELLAEAIAESGVSIDSDGLRETRGTRRGISDDFSTGGMKSRLHSRRRGRSMF